MSFNTKKFRSRTGEAVRLALLSGHVAIVGSEWEDLHERFFEMAYSRGCISEDMIANQAIQQVDIKVLDQLQSKQDLKDRIKTALEKAIKENNLDAFNNKGNPKQGYLKAEINEPVPNHIKDEVWSEMLESGYTITTGEELKDDIT